MTRKNPPIASAPVINMVMLRNGHMVPVENGHDPASIRPPKSKKERRTRKKTLALSVRRLVKHRTWR